MTRIYIICSIIITGMLSGGCKDKRASNGEITSNKTGQGATSKEAVKNILFFGNSLTAGYGLEPEQAFPSLIQNKIDSAGLKYKVVNAGVSGETTAGGKSKIDWILKQPIDIFILELGANDGLRGIPVNETKRNLQAIIDKVKGKYPQAKIILAGMQIPPNMGADYTTAFKNVFTDLAASNSLALIPFLLEGVGGNRALNLPDGIHPSAEGHKIIAENVWKFIEGIL